jgi:GMP synthase-like glutamine amidotransferase
MRRPSVLIVQNTPAGGPRRLAGWLTAEDLEVDVVVASGGTPLPETLGHDALIVLGGGYMPDDDHRAPWLAQTRALATQALEQGRPMLGICLGGQLLALVADGMAEYVPNPAHRRAKLLRPTERGLRAIDILRPRQHEWADQVTESFDAEELEETVGTLRRVIVELDREPWKPTPN